MKNCITDILRNGIACRLGKFHIGLINDFVDIKTLGRLISISVRVIFFGLLGRHGMPSKRLRFPFQNKMSL